MDKDTTTAPVLLTALLVLAEVFILPNTVGTLIPTHLVPLAMLAWVLLIFLTLPIGTYLAVERSHRERWSQRAIHAESVGVGSYRNATVMVEDSLVEQAPAAVRLAAFTSLFLGQMFVPGLVLGLVGLFVYGVGVVAIPGLIVAARIFSIGLGLLRRDYDIVERLDKATSGALLLNVPIVIVAGIITVGGIANNGGSMSLPITPVVSGFTMVYAMVSIAHATLLNHVAGLLRQQAIADDAEPAVSYAV